MRSGIARVKGEVHRGETRCGEKTTTEGQRTGETVWARGDHMTQGKGCGRVKAPKTKEPSKEENFLETSEKKKDKGVMPGEKERKRMTVSETAHQGRLY